MGYVGGMTATKILPQQLMQVLGAGMVSQEQTRTIYAYGPEAVVFALLMLCQHLAELYAQLASVTFYPNGGANSSGPPKGAERQNAQRFGPDKQVLPFGEEKASLAQMPAPHSISHAGKFRRQNQSKAPSLLLG